MTTATNPFRPYTEALSDLEVEAAKSEIMHDYHRGGMSLPMATSSFSKLAQLVPDRAKSMIAGTLNDYETQEEVKARFELHMLDKMLEKTGPYARPIGGRPDGNDKSFMTKDALDSGITNSVGGGVLARQDLVPQVYLWLNTRFPALERIARIPANGLNHTWNNEIDFGDASDDFLDEFGSPVYNHGTYFRGETNIAILAVARAVNLKLDYGIRAGGVLYNGGMDAYDLELQNAVLSRAKILQKCFYYGVTDQNHDGSDEFGKTFLNGFCGLRVQISNHANTVHSGFYPTGFGPVIEECTIAEADVTAGKFPFSDAIDRVAGRIMDNGGMPTAVHMSTRAEQRLRREGTNVLRYMETDATVGGGLVMGGRVRAVDTVAGLLPVIIIPGGGIGKYAIAAGDDSDFTNGTEVEDVYVLSENYLQFPYLGSADPMPIEIPTGIPDQFGRGALQRRMFIFWMIGLANPVPIFQGKVRIAAV